MKIKEDQDKNINKRIENMKKSSHYIVLGSMFCSLLIVCQSFGNESETHEKAPQIVSSKEKLIPGSSIENPIVVTGVKKYSQIRDKQDDYIRKHYEDYNVVYEAYTMNSDGHFIQFFSLKNGEGERIRVCFDMTDTYKTLAHSRDKQTKEKIKQLKIWHMPREKSSESKK